MKACVFEKNPKVRQVFKAIFSEKGYDVEFVSDPAGFDGTGYDLVILEEPLPGIDVTKLGKQVFFLSTYMTPRAEEFAPFMETLEIIDKPFALVNLLAQREITAR
jgi:DNA-binding response OmpR family regulator